ncbi:MAG TPA: transporter substrate-binding domain-containing protein [Casimicrobiaceae bacterium]|jgi:polar amino acid transport system substrate-binding protein
MKHVFAIVVASLVALSVTTPLSVNAAAPANANAAPKGTAPAKKATAAAQKPIAVGHLLQAIRKRGTIIVGIAPQIPWVMRDPAGEWQGYEIDVARQLASDLGVELVLVRFPFIQLTDALADGTVDIVSAGYSITPQRALVVDFSNPYATSEMQLVARADLAVRDLNRADMTLGARAGGTTEASARARFPQAKVVTFPTDRALYGALKVGQVDGALAYVPRTSVAVAQSEGKLAVVAGTSLPHTVEGFAIRKGEQPLLNFLNAWIAYWKADGWLDERRRYWFETLDWTARFNREAAAK